MLQKTYKKERKKDRKTERQKDRKTERKKERKTERKKERFRLHVIIIGLFFPVLKHGQKSL